MDFALTQDTGAINTIIVVKLYLSYEQVRETKTVRGENLKKNPCHLNISAIIGLNFYT